MKRKLGIFLVVLGLLGGLATAGIYIYTEREDRAAAASAEAGMDAILTYMAQEVKAVVESEEIPNELSEDVVQEIAVAPAEIPKAVVLDGVEYVGYISFPGRGKSFPVIAEYTEEFLKMGPVVITGSPEEPGFVIAGHNYKSQLGFVTIMKKGEQVRYTCVDGTVYDYTVERVDTVHGDDAETMHSGDWDLTVYTCHLGGETRCTLRCTLTDRL